MDVQVEITETPLTLSVSSSQINFGQVSRGLGSVMIDPAAGERSGPPSDTWSAGTLRITGPPGAEYAVQVIAPRNLTAVAEQGAMPRYSLLWARSPHCTNTRYTAIQDKTRHSSTLNSDGCAMLRFGGSLAVNGATAGMYRGRLNVRVTQL